MAGLRQVAEQVRQVWQQWPTRRRVLALGLTGAVLVGLLTLILLGGDQPSTPLMTNLSPADAAAIMKKLEAKQIPHRVGANGTTIYVPRGKVHELRIQLAAQGLPKGGGVGFELFDESEVGRSRFSEQVNYHRALEGELRRTVRGLDAVKDARVHIVMPKRRLFQQDQDKASASVTLTMLPGRTPATSQVNAIVHLLASSVPGLSADRVTVVDSRGNLLSQPRSGNGLGLSPDRLQQKREIETMLERRIQRLLSPVVGQKNLTASVNVDLASSVKNTTTERYDPDGAVLRSEQTEEERRGDVQAEAQGIPGIQADLDGANAGQQKEQDGERRTRQTRNYEISKTVTHEEQTAGRIARLSVAVLVAKPAVEQGPNKEADVAQERLDELTQLVKGAVGFNASRGDEVVVRSAPFVRVAPEADGSGDPIWLRYLRELWRPAIAALGLLALIGLLLMGRRNRPQTQAHVLSQPKTVRELEADLDAQEASLPQGAEPKALGAGKPPPEPSQAAAVIKGWLNQP